MSDLAQKTPLLIVAGAALTGAVIGTILTGAIMVRSIDQKASHIIDRAARMNESYALSKARMISGPGGLGRIMILPEGEGPLTPVDCPANLSTPAVCLRLGNR